MIPLKSIIVDDEPAARSMLKNIINEYCPNIVVVAEAQNVKEAVSLIQKHKIELVFLDIEMPNENGFALFNYFETPTFETIFCTAYSEYAMKAFEVSAVDYLLKPIGISKLKQSIEKAIKLVGQNQILQRINVLRDNIEVGTLQKIALPMADGLVFVKLDDVLYFEADGSYTQVVTNTATHLVSKKIKEFEELLYSDNRFFRTHRSYLVNVLQIKKYTKKDGAMLAFENETKIPVSREKREDFDGFISNLKV